MFTAFLLAAALPLSPVQDDRAEAPRAEKKICKGQAKTGTRVRAKRVCKTQAEWDADAQLNQDQARGMSNMQSR
ncbi:hypothetical protein [Sphingomonas sp.]|uniref:hypothetical protein n=1 Tax=Sphingomonas sp. TaxID=28214 RepID=UPI002C2674D3|nr:hypothetical protein [Sphingomonas sp.]HTG38682.1 hypothetical protein [Sphingomonas sp.]